MTDLQKTAVDAFVSLNDLAILNPNYLDVVGRSTSLQTRVLIELVQRFNNSYAQRKSNLNGLDFADLERYTLQLLTTEDPCGERLSPSETGLALRKRFKYIFVDEYQDINPVQQAILDALSSGNNVFVVGDVKQSIYAWRGAEPTIFLDRLRPASPDPKDPCPRLPRGPQLQLPLGQGHSGLRQQDLRADHDREIAHIDYDEASMLRPAPDRGRRSGLRRTDRLPRQPIVELHILDERGNSRGTQDEDGRRGRRKATTRSRDPQAAIRNPQSEDLALINARQRQAALIARRIREIVGAETGRAEFQIQDRQTGELPRCAVSRHRDPHAVAGQEGE